MGWPRVALGEVGHQFDEYVTELEPRDYKKLSVKLYGKGVVLDKTVDGSSVKMKKHQIAREGQIIVSEIWAKKGAIGIVPSEGEGALCTSHFFLFDIDDSIVDLRWIHYLCVGNYFEPQVGGEARGTTSYASVRPQRFLACTIPLPPLAEQQRIADRLDRVAALVAARREAVAAVERETRALLLKVFARAIDGAPRRPMRDVAPLTRRPVEIEPDREYPELGVRSFGRGTFHKPDLIGAALTWQKLFRVEAGDLVFSNIKAWEGAFAVASAADHGRVGSHRYLTCVPDAGAVTAGFLWFHLQTEDGLTSVQEASPGSADRNRTLGLKRLEAITAPVPPIERQRAFDALQARARDIRDARAQAETDLDALLPALLHEAFGDAGGAL